VGKHFGCAPVAAYIGVMTLVPLLSNLAIPPMLTVTFLGSLYSALPDSHLEPTLLAASMALGWALNLTASPFGATALILSRITNIPGTTLSWRWNTGFTLAAWAGLPRYCLQPRAYSHAEPLSCCVDAT
jgi:hypothetical protein